MFQLSFAFVPAIPRTLDRYEDHSIFTCLEAIISNLYIAV